jgi:geranylgeranyl diphosphate synthase type I
MSVLDRNDLRVRVQQALDAFLDTHEPGLLGMAQELAPMVDEVRAFLSGGKRLRPGFCFWGHLGAGGRDSDELVRAAAALELFQAAAIIHDDVMDGSDTRRGRPSVHKRFAAMHGEQFGIGAAILLGDLCLSWSEEMLVRSTLVSDSSRAVFDTMRAELMAGQYLDLLEQADGTGTVESALRVARYKSAKYTIVEPLHLGGTTAGASQEVLDAYTAFGHPLGIAFQLRDDLLGVFGDPAVTGKPAGDDLREGKRTVLVAMALRQTTPAQADLVRRKLGDPDLDAEGVADLRDVLVTTGAVDEVEKLIATSTDEALAALDDRITDEARDVLQALALEATRRST